MHFRLAGTREDDKKLMVEEVKESYDGLIWGRRMPEKSLCDTPDIADVGTSANQIQFEARSRG